MNNIKRKLLMAVTAAAVVAGGAVASPQAAGAAGATPNGANCWGWGQCATLSNDGTTDIWVDGKVDNVFARTRLLPAGYQMTWGNRFPIEGFWLATGDCAWTKDVTSSKWQSYWGSKSRYTYVHMDDFDTWDIYKKPCGSST